MHWRAKLDSMKQRAASQTRRATVGSCKIFDEMGLCAPDVRAGKVTKDDVESFYASARDLGVDPRPSAVTATHGWLLLLSGVATIDGGFVWHLAASLNPSGRSSTTNDWKMLGHFIMHLSVPKDPPILPEDPIRVVHWQWLEAA